MSNITEGHLTTPKAVGLAKQSTYFLIGNLFTLIVGFSFQVYLAKVLGADGLGQFGLYDSVVTLFTGLLGFGLAQAVVKYIPLYQVKSDFFSIRHLIRTGFKRLAIIGLTVYLIAILFAYIASLFFEELTQYFVPASVMGLMLPIGLLLFFALQVLRGFYDIRYMVIGSSFLQLTAKVLLSVVFFTLGFKLMGYLWAVVISTLIALLWMLKGIIKHLKLVPVIKDPAAMSGVDESWKIYARTMYGNSLLGAFAGQLDRFVLGYFLGASSVGVLMVAKVINGLPCIFLLMFIAVVSPLLSAAYAKSDMQEFFDLYHLTTDWLMRLSFPLLIFLFFFSKDVLSLYGSDFVLQGYIPLFILLFSQLINLACGPIGISLNMSGLENENFKVSIKTTIMSFFFIILLTPFWGMIGTSIAISLPIIYQNLVCLRIAKSKIGMTWWSKKYLKNIFPMVSASFFSLFIFLNRERFSFVELMITLCGVYFVYWMTHLLHGLSADDKLVVNIFRDKLRVFLK